eukprot:Skav222861  [mRNA]  locus=scaffold2201:87314:93953:- [translate_table: standard]
MAAGVALYHGAKLGPPEFAAVFGQCKSYVLFEALDNQDQPQGLALGEITKRYKPDDDGGFLEIKYIQATDEYYRHWVAESRAHTLLHHICRLTLRTCQRKVGKEEIVHVQRFAPMTKEQKDKVLKEWRLKPLGEPGPLVKGKVLEEEEAVGATPKSGARKRSGGHDTAYGLEENDFDSSLSPSVEEPAKKKKPRVDEAAEPRGERKEVARRGPRDSNPRRSKGRDPGEGRESGATLRANPRSSALDEVVDGSVEEELLPGDANERRLIELRARLGDAKKKEGKASAMKVLADRIHRGAEREDSKRKKNRNHKMVEALKTLAGGSRGRRHSSRSSSEDSMDIEEEVFRGSSRDLVSKQKKLRRVAQDRPGALLVKGYSLMHDQLGSLYGDYTRGEGADRVLQPAAVRYLLTAALPQLNMKKIGEEKLREMRTVAASLDHIISGKATEAADMLMQRLKSLLMSERDGSNVASKYLELIPLEVYPSGTTEEEIGFARQAALRAAKSDEVMKLKHEGKRYEVITGNIASCEEEQEPKEEIHLTESDFRGEPQRDERERGRWPRTDANEGGTRGLSKKGGRIPDSMEEQDVPGEESCRRESKEVRLNRVPVEAGSMVDSFDDDHPVRAGIAERASTSLPVKAGSLRPNALGSKRAQGNQPSGHESIFVSPLVPVDSTAGNPGVSGNSPRGDTAAKNAEMDELCSLLKVHCEETVFSSFCNEAAMFGPSVLQLGVSALQLLLLCPRDGKFLHRWLQSQRGFTSPTRGRDVLPMPRPPVGAAIMLLKQLQSTPSGLLRVCPNKLGISRSRKRQKFSKVVNEGCKQLWRLLVVGVLNGLACWWAPEKCHGQRMSESQTAALRNIDQWIAKFCSSPLAQVKLPNFEELIKQRNIDYAGEEVGHALPLKLGELEPGLPVAGVAGSLNAVEAAAPQVRAWVEDPRLALKDKSLWPPKVPSAKINATKSEWYKVVEALYKRGIVAPIKLSEVFTVDGTPVLNGAFAVNKKGDPAPGECRVTRLIMNLVPANSYQVLMSGDLATLSSSTAWGSIVLQRDQVLLWSGDDQRGAFYAWALPEPWRAFMAFRWAVPGKLVGVEAPWSYVAARVIPMGWINAVSLFQHLHRQLGMLEKPLGAGHLPHTEWRRDMPVPLDSSGELQHFVQFYLDDFDTPEIVPSEGWEKLKGSMSSTHREQRKAYSRWGVGIADDKAHLRQPRVIRMGAEVDGVLGTISAPQDKKMEVGYFSLWFLGKRFPATKTRLMVLGRWVRCFEFRRPLMHLLQESWPKGPLGVRRPTTMLVAQELLTAIALLPLAGTSLRAAVDPMVTCSDASETGGGLCAGGGLTDEGHNVLSMLQSQQAKRDRVCAFSPLGAVPVTTPTGPRVVVVSLFDGVAALICSLVRLPVQVICFASSEIDKQCKRLVRKRWPGVLELGSIETIDEEVIRRLAQSVGYRVDLVLAGGGSPCQDLSALLANRQGLAGSRSKLFFKMPKIFNLLAKHFGCPVYSFVENVFSMTADNRRQFSETLNCKPVLIDSRHVSWCRRPRLFWCNWPVSARNGERLLDHGDYCEWVLEDSRLSAGHWTDPGCVQAQLGMMPTLTRALPRKTPPRCPAGINQASEAAKQRWRDDCHRFQVYQYEEQYLVAKSDGSLRVPSLTERERLMGFTPGYISNCLDPKLTFQQNFDMGACMIGNSFHVHVITYLLDELLCTVNAAHSPRQLGSMLELGPPAPKGWCSSPTFMPGCKPDKQAGSLVYEFMRHGEKAGSDVRLDVGIPYRIKAWPRAGIRSHLFHWRIVHGYKWKHKAHINVLEMQAVVNSLQWRLRRSSQAQKRVLHLIDNQVCASVIVKGRSSSRRLHKALLKLNALCLASGLYLSIGYLHSEDNPCGTTLSEQLVSDQLHKRYLAAATRVLQFWQESGLSPGRWEEFDVCTSAWIEHIYAEGMPKGYGSDGVAALQHFLPEISGHMRNSWRLLKTWNKVEPPLRVIPINPLVITAMAGLCVQVGWPRAAALLLVGFDCLLRPGELYRLQQQDIVWASGRATLTLRDTKSGQRKGATEMVFCESLIATKWLRRCCSNLRPTAPLLDRTPAEFRALFFNLVDYLNVPGHLSLYSLRRGGATWHFVSTQSLESTLLRGRWQSTSTARIYLQDAAAALSTFQLTADQRRYFRSLSHILDSA